MSVENFEIGDLVWATMKRFPCWPGKIIAPPKNEEAKAGKHYVFFFGTNNHACISSENIFHHAVHRIPPIRSKRNSLFKDAVECIKHLSRQNIEDNTNIEKSPREEVTENITTKKIKMKGRKRKKYVNLLGKKRGKEPGNKKVKKLYMKNGNECFLSNCSEIAETSESVEDSTCSKNLSNHSEVAGTSENIEDISCYEIIEIDNDDSNHSEVAGTSENIEDIPCSEIENIEDIPCSEILEVDNDDKSASSSSSNKSFVLHLATNGNSMPTKETSPVAENKFQKRSEVKLDPPTTQRIGFLGLGNMGFRIVKSLLSSGHNVTVWNKTEEKCKECVDAGAVRVATPAEVVKASDIIFSCVSDALAVTTILFGADGVLKGFQDCSIEENNLKGFVELSSIDFETTQTAADAIINKRGRYLEAPVIGTKELAETASLFILASGDLNLFYACESCFRSFASHSYYVSFEIGESAKYNTALNMFWGTSYAALMETLSFANRLEISTDTFLEILAIRGYMSETLIKKGKAFISRDFSDMDVTLKHLKKAMSLALNLSNNYTQPVSVSAAANDFFKCSNFRNFVKHTTDAAHQEKK